MPRNSPPLLLEQRLNRRANSGLHCSETSLRLTDDERELVLSRYIELYRPEGVEWVERSHRISVNALLRWIIAWCGLSASWFLEDEDPLAEVNLAILAKAAAALAD